MAGPVQAPAALRSHRAAALAGRREAPGTDPVAVLGGPIYRSALAGPAHSGTAGAGRSAVHPPGVHTQPVPPEVAGPFQALTGLDVTGIRVHRGPGVSVEARGHQARAFTRGGEIFLPDEAGPLDHGDTRALLAHELTHAIQQRVLSPALPNESSPDGQELESEADQAEEWYRSGGATPLRLAHLPTATPLAGRAGSTGADGDGEPSTGRILWSADALDFGSAARGGVQRQGGSHQPPRAGSAAGPAQLVPAIGTVTAMPAGGGSSGPGALTVFPGASGLTWLAGPQAPPSEQASTGLVQPAAGGTATGPAAGKEELGDLAEHSERLVSLAKKRPADLDDPTSLDELARKVYPRLRGMLRGELLTDRERSGLLADFS